MLSRTNRRTASKLGRHVSVHSYGGHPSQVGEVFEPDADPVGVAVVLHGGFWRADYDRHLMDDLCRDLATNGWLAWNLEYRRLGDGGGWPETFDDVEAGIAQLPADHVPRVAIGHSAGGHLALWAATRGIGVTHAVSQAGVVDLHEADRLGLSRNAARELLGCDPDTNPKRWRTASPAALAPLGVPQLLVHGEDDDEVPATLSSAHAAKDTDAQLRLLPGVGHYEHLDPRSTAWTTVREFLEGLAA
jgi:acetyl esterase/lipase